MDLEVVFKPHLLNLEIALDGLKLQLQGNDRFLPPLQGETQISGKLPHKLVNALRRLVGESINGVDDIEQEMRVDLLTKRLQTGFHKQALGFFHAPPILLRLLKVMTILFESFCQRVEPPGKAANLVARRDGQATIEMAGLKVPGKVLTVLNAARQRIGNEIHGTPHKHEENAGDKKSDALDSSDRSEDLPQWHLHNEHQPRLVQSPVGSHPDSPPRLVFDNPVVLREHLANRRNIVGHVRQIDELTPGRLSVQLLQGQTRVNNVCSPGLPDGQRLHQAVVDPSEVESGPEHGPAPSLGRDRGVQSDADSLP